MSVFPAARVGDSVDAPALITGSPNSHVLLNGFPLAVIGATVAGHGGAPHASPVFAIGSAVMLINGLGVVRTGHPATCGHVAVGTTHVRLSA